MRRKVLYSSKYSILDADETKLVQKAAALASTFVKVSRKINPEKFKTRGAHAKSYGVFYGDLILNGKDAVAQQIFGNQNIKVIIRLSNATMVNSAGKDMLPVYGFALKVLNVAHGKDANIPLVNFPVFPTNSVSKFVRLFAAANRYMIAHARFGLFSTVFLPGVALKGMAFLPNLIDFDLFTQSFKLGYNRNLNPLFFSYHSVGCYRFGDFVVKFKVDFVASGSSPKEIGENSQKSAVEKILNSDDLVFSLKIQYCTNEDWINDLTKVWNDRKFHEIGTISVKKNSLLNPAKTELLSFNPFENPDELKPVGRMQKVREAIYHATVAARRS